MTNERFEKLYEAARTAAHATGTNLTERTNAKRQLRQALDVLSLNCDKAQWAAVEWARRNNYPEWTVLKDGGFF